MPTVANLAVSLTARLSAFERGMMRARRNVRRFSRDIRRQTSILRGHTAALAAVATGGGLGFLIKGQFDAVDAISKASDTLGIQVSSLVALRQAAQLSGVETRTLEKGMKNLAERVSEAAAGTGEARDSIAALGLDAARLRDLPLDAQLKAVGEAMAGVKRQTDQIRISADLFGGRGVDLLRVLKLIRGEGFAELEQEVRKTGLAFSRVEGAQIEQAVDAMGRLRNVMLGIGRVVAIEIAPVLQKLSEQFVASATDGEGMGARVRESLDGATRAAARLADIGNLLTGVWLGFQGVIQTLGAWATRVLTWMAKHIQRIVNLIPGIQVDLATLPETLSNSFAEAARTSFSGAADALTRFATDANQKAVEKFILDARKTSEQAARKLTQSSRSAADLPGLDAAAGRRGGEFKAIDLERVALGRGVGAGAPQQVTSPAFTSMIDELRRIRQNTAGDAAAVAV